MVSVTKKREWLIQISILIVAFSLYLINSKIIKPNINEENSLLEYFMYNQFNDFLCPIVLCSLIGSITSILKKEIISSVIIYLIVFVISALVWEVLRPYILLVFNPFNKVAHFKFGDIVAYFLGYSAHYIYIVFRYRIKRSEKVKN